LSAYWLLVGLLEDYLGYGNSIIRGQSLASRQITNWDNNSLRWKNNSSCHSKTQQAQPTQWNEEKVRPDPK
jgi:hypothetical protein